MLTCNGSAACNTARNAVSTTGSGSGNPYSNNGFTMQYIDADGTGIAPGIGTNSFSSSSSDLVLGSTGGCGVIYALLTWGGNINTAQAGYANRDKVYFRTPGSASYTQLTADLKYDATSPFSGYYCYKDVTNIVKASGGGTYWVANQILQTGNNNLSGGWTLIVIYSDPALALRNLTVFRGLAAVSGTAIDVPITGFFTPPSPAPINLKLGVYALEGDRGGAGDLLSFNGAGSFVAVGDAKHPTTPAASANSFTSTINNNTAEYTTNNPYYPNTLGMDANIFVPNNTAKNFIGNSTSSATLRMATTGDVYAPFAITTAIDVFEPNIKADMSYVNLNGNSPAQLGDIIEYTISLTNNGTDPAENLIIIDSLYGAMNFVPGSLEILTGPNAGAKTDAIGDDQLEYVPATNVVRARLGVGATGVDVTGGGTLSHIAPNNTTSFKFRVAITNDCTMFLCNSKLDNVAYATFKGFTSQGIRSTYSSANGFDALGCPLTGPVSVQVTVPPCPVPPDTTFANCAPYNPNLLLPKRPGYTTFLNSAKNVVTNFATSGTYYLVRTLTPSFTWMPACGDTVEVNFTSTGPCLLPVTFISFDGSLNNNLAHLRWKTTNEINNLKYIVERSIDGINFNSIGEVLPIGQLTNEYSFTDNTLPSSEKFYYRLRQTDIDGQFKFSNIILLKRNNTNSGLDIVAIAPNPSGGDANITVLAAKKGMHLVQLIDMAGRQVFAETVFMPEGTYSFLLRRKNILSGIYNIKISEIQSKINTNSKIIFR